MQETPNTNCLEGVRCPKCQQQDGFYIEALIKVYVTDDGTEDQGGNYIWSESSPCACGDCGHAGPLAEFTEGGAPVKAANCHHELLAAVEDLLSCSELNLDDLENSTLKSIEDARAAIAKAEGGAP